MQDDIHNSERAAPTMPKEASVIRPGMTLYSFSRFPRFDGDGGEDGKDPGVPAKKPTVEQRIEDELEKRYKPRSVREWLAQYSDNAELALEKAVDMLNDRIQKQIKSETKLGVDIEELQAKLGDAQGQLKTVSEERDGLKSSIEKAEAEERQKVLADALKKSFPETHKELRLALKDQGYELVLNDKGDEVMVAKGDKRHQLKTVLTDEFYKEYPFVKAKDEKPFNGDGERADTDFGESVAGAFKELSRKPSFDFGEKE